jgi:uncharacterized protein (TIGR03435 family)
MNSTLTLSALALVGGFALAQTAVPLKFEVASIKASRADDNGPDDISPSGAMSINTTIKMQILIAYQLKEYQLAGGPKWIETEFYRIVAKPPSGPIPESQKQRMDAHSERMRNLLEDRFHLAAHHETRTLTQYSLVVAKGGPKMKEVERNPPAFRLQNGSDRVVTSGGAKVAMLANLLSIKLGYPVVDKTGLDAYYDFDLHYAPENKPEAGPSIFTALQEQCGLKLDAGKGPIEVLVIDRIDRPAVD